MKELLWRLVAFIVTRQAIRRWIIKRAMRTPYTHIFSPDRTERFIGRWWLFNAYKDDHKKSWSWMPSIRIHHIAHGDLSPHMHSHPWPCRTIILSGWYFEQVPRQSGKGTVALCRDKGYTGAIHPMDYHRIKCVPIGGTWTMFFTWDRWGEWGFLVDGKHVPHREYLEGRK